MVFWRWLSRFSGLDRRRKNRNRSRLAAVAKADDMADLGVIKTIVELGLGPASFLFLIVFGWQILTWFRTDLKAQVTGLTNEVRDLVLEQRTTNRNVERILQHLESSTPYVGVERRGEPQRRRDGP
jgi:hypothetical protein